MRRFTNQCGQTFVDNGIGFVPQNLGVVVNSAALQQAVRQVTEVSEVGSCPPGFSAYKYGQTPGQPPPWPGSRYVGQSSKVLSDGTTCVKWGTVEKIPQSELCAFLSQDYKEQTNLIRSKINQIGSDRAKSWLIDEFSQAVYGNDGNNDGPIRMAYYLALMEKGQNALKRQGTVSGWFLNASGQDKKRWAEFFINCIGTVANVSVQSLPAGF